MDIDQIHSYLKQLTKSQGWHVLKDQLQKSVEQIEQEILSGKSEEKNKIKYTEYDILRETRNVMKSMIDYPEDMIRQLEEQLENWLDDEDPYIQN